MAALSPSGLLGPAPEESDSRDRLADAAVRCFATRPIADVTFVEIAEAAGVHHSTLYRNFRGLMSGLLAYLGERSDRHVREVVTHITTSIGELPPRELVTRVATELLSIITQGPLATMLEHNADAVISYALTPCAGLRTTTGDLLRDYLFELDPDLDTDRVAAAADAFVFDVLAEWIRSFPENTLPDTKWIESKVEDLFGAVGFDPEA